MFANAFQSGFISIFYSVGSAPLAIWNKEVKNGHIRRIVDEEVKSLVLEISGSNVATTYITCPQKPRMSLAIKLPFLVMIIKNMKKYFTFEIQILDDKDIRRRFRVSNFQSTTKVRPFCTTMPIGLSDGWNQVQFNLADFTKRAYGSTYLETVRVQVHANVRIRRIYFSDTLYSEDEMPNEFRLFLPTTATKGAASKIKDKGTDVNVYFIGTSLGLNFSGKADKKEALKPVEEVPSGAPPSPAEPSSPGPVAQEPTPVAEPEPEPEPELEPVIVEEIAVENVSPLQAPPSEAAPLETAPAEVEDAAPLEAAPEATEGSKHSITEEAPNAEPEKAAVEEEKPPVEGETAPEGETVPEGETPAVEPAKEETAPEAEQVAEATEEAPPAETT